MEPKFTLCLSGGGFRATLFHLGVVAALRAKKQLRRVKRITSASGGSIVAAHLVLNWDRYNGTDDEFRKAVTEVTDFIRADVRGRILRRWFFLGGLSRFGRTHQLIRRYDKLFGEKRLGDLRKSGPDLFITCASMSSGKLCWFTSSGLCRDCLADSVENLKYVRMSFLSVATAVAASSAFPPMFPPVVLDPRKLPRLEGDLGGGERLTDGGVFDNLGIRAALQFEDDDPTVVSNASATFDRNSVSDYRSIFGRTIRTTDILMSRIATLEKEGNLKRPLPNIRYVEISEVVVPERGYLPEEVNNLYGHDALPDALQQLVQNVRTDFDDFSTDEIRVIYLHGYEVGLRTAFDPSNVSAPDIGPTWDPSRPTTKREEFDDWLREQFRRPRRPAELGRAEANLLHAITVAENRRLHLWNARDGFCWIVLAALSVPGALLWHYDVGQHILPALRGIYVSAATPQPDSSVRMRNCGAVMDSETFVSNGYSSYSHAVDSYRTLKVQQEQWIRMRYPDDHPSENIGMHKEKEAAAAAVHQHIRGPVTKLLAGAYRDESAFESVIATCTPLVNEGSRDSGPVIQKCASAVIEARDVGGSVQRASASFEKLSAANLSAASSRMAEYPGFDAPQDMGKYRGHLQFFDAQFEDIDQAVNELAQSISPLNDAVQGMKVACEIAVPGAP
jgi:predicted acylesterase/phospholipase RssA